jgi:hypothetical protein
MEFVGEGADQWQTVLLGNGSVMRETGTGFTMQGNTGMVQHILIVNQ